MEILAHLAVSEASAYSHEDDHSFSPKLNTCSHPC
jgi:hypothetical protein